MTLGRSESLVVINIKRDKEHNNKTSPHSLKADSGGDDLKLRSEDKAKFKLNSVVHSDMDYSILLFYSTLFFYSITLFYGYYIHIALFRLQSFRMAILGC